MDECFSAPNDAILVRLAVVAPAALSLGIERSEAIMAASVITAVARNRRRPQSMSSQTYLSGLTLTCERRSDHRRHTAPTLCDPVTSSSSQGVENENVAPGPYSMRPRYGRVQADG